MTITDFDVNLNIEILGHLKKQSFQKAFKNNVYASFYIKPGKPADGESDGENAQAYGIFYKNGIPYLKTESLYQLMNISTLSYCDYGTEDSILLIGTGNWQGLENSIFVIKVNSDGTLGDPYEPMFTVEKLQEPQCHHILLDKFWVSVTQEIDANDHDIQVFTLDYAGSGNISGLKVIHAPDSNLNMQIESDIIQLKDINAAKGIAAWVGQGQGITLSNSAIHYAIIDHTQNVGTPTGNFGTEYFLTPETEADKDRWFNNISLHPLEDGGFLIVAEENKSGTGEIWLFNIANTLDNTATCAKKVNTSPGFNPSFIVYDSIIYITYISEDKAAGTVYALEVDIDTCEPSTSPSEITIFETTAQGYPAISLNPETTTTITIGIQYFENQGADTFQIRYSEYLIEQIGLCSQGEHCAGCYGNKKDECSVCNGSDFLQRIRRTTPDGECGCADGFFSQEGSIDCIQCHNKCETCIDIDNCKVCKGATRTGAPACGCAPQHFDDGVSVDCQQCDPLCESCANTSDNCLTCFDNLETRILPSCACKDSYYEANLIKCRKCDYQCKQCVIDSDNCTECADTEWRTVLPSCYCDIGSCNIIEQPKCVACMEFCYYCETPDVCLQCVDPSRDEAKDCACRDGKYESGIDRCLDQCDPQCVDCVGSADNCTVCVSNKINLPYCDTCEDGYYGEGVAAFCKKCSANCKLCKGTSSFCTQCTNELYMLPNCVRIQQGNVSIANEQGIWVDYQCHILCSTCEVRIDNCSSCFGNYRQQDAPLCSCQKGYFDEGNDNPDCQQCPKGCTACSSRAICTECNSDRELKENQCICGTGTSLIGTECQSQCSKDQFRNDQNICQECYYHKSTVCLSVCPANTNPNKSTFKCEEDTFNYFLVVVIAGVVLIAILICFFGCHKAYDHNQQLKKEEKRVMEQYQIAQQNQENINNNDENNNNNDNNSRRLSQDEQQFDIDDEQSIGQSVNQSCAQLQLNPSNQKKNSEDINTPIRKNNISSSDESSQGIFNNNATGQSNRLMSNGSVSSQRQGRSRFRSQQKSVQSFQNQSNQVDDANSDHSPSNIGGLNNNNSVGKFQQQGVKLSEYQPSEQENIKNKDEQEIYDQNDDIEQLEDI